ncbi:hypothetical protein [Sporanaerobacter acetigenes]|uniref:Uncharacterized protein n=1 Tax=Sporanaerobacter acetigenes DSM 13106 TaxID=1123281 RepID=A0A1M5WL37_9FIRM|nr:hypothetical protein [Sporanaerobacter acetigenes]SHH88231.1 hypothetical protein SAMN02745180_01290 [Sporanaerobacter acetigenes DSM 13106]
MDYSLNIPYPELYYRIYPKVISAISRSTDNLSVDGNVSEEQVDKMVDEVYEQMLAECPEIGEDPMERRQRSSRYKAMQRPYYGRGRLVRDIISIILISELLRRRYPYNYYGYGPGYGYEPWY